MVDIRELSVGDKVRVRSDLVEEDRYNGVIVVAKMLQFAGKVMTVCDIGYDNTIYVGHGEPPVDLVEFEEDAAIGRGKFVWSPDMLEEALIVRSADLMECLAGGECND